MTLLVFEHELRVTTPHEAAALFLELGNERVSVKGWSPRDAAAIDRLVAAMTPYEADTINFEDGTFDDATGAALAALLESRPGYVDIRDERHTNLRVWPERAWVHLPDGGATREYNGGGAVTLGALDRYRTVASERVSEGFIMHVTAASKPRLPAFLHALRATTVTAQLELTPDAAVALFAHLPDGELEWQADRTIVRLPAGTIMNHQTRETETQVPAWKQRVSNALAKIRG